MLHFNDEILSVRPIPIQAYPKVNYGPSIDKAHVVEASSIGVRIQQLVIHVLKQAAYNASARLRHVTCGISARLKDIFCVVLLARWRLIGVMYVTPSTESGLIISSYNTFHR